MFKLEDLILNPMFSPTTNCTTNIWVPGEAFDSVNKGFSGLFEWNSNNQCFSNSISI